MENQPLPTTKNWLQRLKDESWEAELLVSAVAIFAILKSFGILDWLVIYFIDTLEPTQYFIAYFITVPGYLAIGILAAMFTIHFTLRAYWIGLVGLNSVFPDYGLEDSAYSPIYTEKLLKFLPKISQSIEKIDELCSVIFSSAFALLMLYSYITISATLFLLFFNLLKDYIHTWILLTPVYLAVFSFLVGILISIPANLKKFHSNEKLQHLYYIYARWGGLIMYGPLRKSILQIIMLFGSNFKKKKGMIKMIVLMLIIGLSFGTVKMFSSKFSYLINSSKGQDTTKIETSFYASQNPSGGFLLTPEINSDVVSPGIIKLFIPVFKHEITLLQKTCQIKGSLKTRNTESKAVAETRKLYIDCFEKQNKIYIDSQQVRIGFLKTYHPRTKQFGITGFINTEDLKNGQHQLRVCKTLNQENKKEWIIPFYSTSRNQGNIK